MNGPPLPGLFARFAPLLDHYGYFAVALFVGVEDFGVPVPGETVLIAAAVYAGAGRLNILAVAVVGFLAAVLGDNVGYLIGRRGGRPVAERWGRYVLLTPARLDRAEAFFNRHGGKVVAAARFVEGLRQANGIIAGITGMHWARFVAFNALGAALWVAVWVSVGDLAGSHLPAIYHAVSQYSLLAALVAVAVAALVVLRHRRSRARERAEAARDTPATR